MNRLWAWFVLLVPAVAMAQADTLAPKSRAEHRLIVEVSGAYGSTALFNDLVTDLYLGRELSKEVRQRSMDALTSANRAGYELEGTLTYTWGTHFLGRKELAPRLSISQQSHMGVRFPKDAFAMAFFGNKAFEGGTAQVGPAAFSQLSYQRLSFGVTHGESGSYAELGVVNGAMLNSARIRKADLHTAEYGQFLELDLDGSYQRSDTATSWSSGLGAAISFAWRTELVLFGQHARLSLGAIDLGFIAWNSTSLSVDKDSLLLYDGLRIRGILDIDDLILNEQSLQDSLGLGYAQGSLITPLPSRLYGRIELGPSRTDGLGQTRYRYGLEVDHRFIPGYIPSLFAMSDLAASPGINAQAGIGYGGYGGFKLAVGLDTQLGQHLNLALGTDHLIGLFSGRARGKALALRLEAIW